MHIVVTQENLPSFPSFSCSSSLHEAASVINVSLYSGHKTTTATIYLSEDGSFSPQIEQRRFGICAFTEAADKTKESMQDAQINHDGEKRKKKKYYRWGGAAFLH